MSLYGSCPISNPGPPPPAGCGGSTAPGIRIQPVSCVRVRSPQTPSGSCGSQIPTRGASNFTLEELVWSKRSGGSAGSSPCGGLATSWRLGCWTA
ncbi:hypothetical protein ACER0C_023706 [Sarotherodon galilaeus]